MRVLADLVVGASVVSLVAAGMYYPYVLAPKSGVLMWAMQAVSLASSALAALIALAWIADLGRVVVDQVVA